MSFGDAWGTHVKELRLDARAVFVVDARDKVVHAEYVKEIAEHPNYDAALAAAQEGGGRSSSVQRRQRDPRAAGAASRAPSRPRPRGSFPRC